MNASYSDMLSVDGEACSKDRSPLCRKGCCTQKWVRNDGEAETAVQNWSGQPVGHGEKADGQQEWEMQVAGRNDFTAAGLGDAHTWQKEISGWNTVWRHWDSLS